MSKFKKVISLVLCIAMLAGTFTFLGDLLAPAVSAAEGTTNVKTYAELDAAYDKFVYVGIDVIELANGELTDGYVQPGDWLEYRATILSDMYVGNCNPHIVYERDFFDVRVITSTTPSTSETFLKADYEGNLKKADGSFMNPAHSNAAPNLATYNTLTAFPYSNVTTQLGFCGIAAATYENWDMVKTDLGVTTTTNNTNLVMTEDNWITSWYVRVKEGLADGETGSSFSPIEIYKHNTNTQTNKPGDARRLADLCTADAAGTYASSKSLALRTANVKHVLLDDTYHTFTIGTGETTGDIAVKFVKLDGTEIYAGDHVKDDVVEVPDVDGLVAWTDRNGNAVELGETITVGESNITYTAVLDTDEFDVKLNLDGGALAEDAVLPEGAVKNEDGSVTIKAGFGEEIDLATMPLPTKEGYTASWNPSTVTVANTKGATVKVTWTANTYNAKFYLDKAAYEAGAEAIKTVEIAYNANLTYGNLNDISALNPEYKFAGWVNAATGEKVSSNIAVGPYKFTEDAAFYADWTKYNSSATVWGRDYENGGWKVLKTKHGDAGSSKLTLTEIKAVVTAENYGSADVIYKAAALKDTYAAADALKADVVMAEGNTDVYVFTSIKFSVALETPKFDENGFITEEYTEEVKTAEASFTDETKLTTSLVSAAAPTAVRTGYKFIGWADAEGNIIPAGNINLDFANGTSYKFTAKYELVEYSIRFAVDNSSAIPEYIDVVGTFTVGDEINLSKVAIVNEKGEDAALPEIGVENSEQVGGPYRGVNGYKFSGWKVGTQTANLVDYDITQDVVLTPDVIKSVTLNETIVIKGAWEALSYDFVAYIAKSYDAEGKPVYEALPAVKVATGASLAGVIAAAEETAKANLPEGKRLSLWKLEDGSAVPNSMPAYGVEIYATYLGKSLSIYLDYNYSTEKAPVALEETMKKNNQYSKFLFDGVDVVNDKVDGDMTIDKMIRVSTVSSAVSPGENYEVVGWNVYYVVNEEDVYNSEMWKEGISDIEGSTIAKYTLIYQVDWMAHKDFLFRVYTSGGELHSAVDKKFNKYYWYMDKPTDKESAKDLNSYPDADIIIGFLPKLDGFDFNRFFEADMWANLSIRIDPIPFAKSWLNPASWGELLKALWSGITSGFGGAIG